MFVCFDVTRAVALSYSLKDKTWSCDFSLWKQACWFVLFCFCCWGSNSLYKCLPLSLPNTNAYIFIAVPFCLFRYALFCVFLYVCIYVHHVHAWCLQSSEEAIRSSGSRVRNGSEPSHGCWDLDPSPLQGLLTSEPLSLAPTAVFLKKQIRAFKCFLHQSSF